MNIFDHPDITFDPSGHRVYRDHGRWREHSVPAPPRVPTPEELEDPVDAREASNVVDGVAHSCRILPDPDAPDLCSGCGKEWPCPDAQRLRVDNLPTFDADPEEQKRMLIAVRAARQAMDLPPEQAERTYL